MCACINTHTPPIWSDNKCWRAKWNRARTTQPVNLEKYNKYIQINVIKRPKIGLNLNYITIHDAMKINLFVDDCGRWLKWCWFSYENLMKWRWFDDDKAVEKIKKRVIICWWKCDENFSSCLWCWVISLFSFLETNDVSK